MFLRKHNTPLDNGKEVLLAGGIKKCFHWGAAAEEEAMTKTTGLRRECQVHKIGLYDIETGIKARLGVTHLLNHGNLSIALAV